ncbi:MAG: patatin-like phospholipase family protein [Anaerolineae bacterium]|nr:patatin-like phospholipase family protein [Anaerolineae bacterium]
MPRIVRILSIDGGGIRGLIPAMVMAEIEKRTGRHTTELFDIIAGTSTGGVLALGIVKPDADGNPAFSAADGIKLYEEEGGAIFDLPMFQRIRSGGSLSDAKYPSDGVESVLKKHFGDIELKQALRDVIITSYEIERNIPWFFRSARAKTDPAYNFPMWQVARSTSAAPTFFEPSKLDVEGLEDYYALVDGAVFANNPTMCAYVDAKTRYQDSEGVLIVSLGTGELMKRAHYDEAKDWGLIGWVRPIINILMHGVSQTVDYQMKQLLPDIEGGMRQYYRFQTKLTEDTSEMDDTRPETMRSLKLLAEELIHERSADIDRLCGDLLRLIEAENRTV